MQCWDQDINAGIFLQELASDDLVEARNEARLGGIVACLIVFLVMNFLVGYIVYKFTRRKLEEILQDLQNIYNNVLKGTIDRLDGEISLLRAELRAQLAAGHGDGGKSASIGVGRYGP